VVLVEAGCRTPADETERRQVMTNYVLAFRGQPDRGAVAGEEEAWGAWFGRIGSSIVDRGNRVGAARTVPATNGGDPATAVLTGYVVVTAADLAAATELARGCPGLANGVNVEVAEIVAM
jgi:hypothetical protein